jgi:hypothetical protein
LSFSKTLQDSINFFLFRQNRQWFYRENEWFHFDDFIKN